jgi:uncharacterized damage-inducible protein DinB
MTEQPSIIPTIYEGWSTYQALLIAAIAPLTAEQLALGVAPGLRTIDDIVRHMIGARGRWFAGLPGDDREALAEFGRWDRGNAPARSAAELVRGLETTWRLMHAAIAGWSSEDWAFTDPAESPTETPAWVIWHLIEHDLHHGGEVSLTLGAHGLAAPDL